MSPPDANPAAAAARPAEPRVAIVGGGPAGLMAAEVLAAAGASVDVFDAMPSVGRKLLLAGRGGLNLTHSEALEPFLARYGSGRPMVEAAVRAFDGPALRAWAEGLGIRTFVGTSGRVFPSEMKAAPLLRAWLSRLRAAGVQFHARHRWVGWEVATATATAVETTRLASAELDGDGARAGPHTLRPAVSAALPAAAAGPAERSRPGPAWRSPALHFAATPRDGHPAHTHWQPDATLLALGGASWPQLGSDGAWVPLLEAAGVRVHPLRPANCGFDIAPTGAGRAHWSALMRERHAGQPVKPVAAWVGGPEDGPQRRRSGEFVLTETGIEGSLVYAHAAALRDALERDGQATFWLDLLPQHDAARVLAEVQHPRGRRSLGAHLQSRLGLGPLKRALLNELLPRATLDEPAALARALKALPLSLAAPRPVAEAISTAGGVAAEALDAHGMLRAVPGVFCAGEMLDWEAPTGGYLLTACMATGRAAALGLIEAWTQSGAKAPD